MEKRDLYDKKRNLTGKTIYKGESVPEGSYIIVVLIYIQNSKGEFLLQKRSANKKTWSNMWDVGGHPKSGEDSIQGILTEVKEEIGVNLNPEKLVKYYGGRSEKERVFWDDYYIKMDVDNIENLKLQEEEVEKVGWFSIDEIKKMNDEGKFFRNRYEEFEVLMDWLKKSE